MLFAVLGVLVAPLVEETIFRGFLYPVIARRLGIAAGVAITGTLFGLMHAAQLWGGWGQIALLILVGIVLTWVRARTGTVAASYFVHLGYNGLQLLGYLFYRDWRRSATDAAATRIRIEGDFEAPMNVAQPIEWTAEGVVMLDQRRLPGEVIRHTYTDYREVAAAIKDMVIRGAPAIGVAAAMGVALGVERSKGAVGWKNFAPSSR